MMGSMRRVARNPIVTAGLKCPEMRMNALTITARMSPCARAISTRPVGVALSFAIMMDAPPTNTRAKVPINSATKCRHESRITGSVIVESTFRSSAEDYRQAAGIRACCQPTTASAYATEDESRVDSAESEGIREDVIDAGALATSRQKVKIARIVGNGEVDRRRKPFALHRQGTDGRLDRSRSTEGMTVVTLRSTHRQSIRVVAEYILDRECLGWIVERCGAPVRIDVIDLPHSDMRVVHRDTHCASGLRSIGARRSHMVGVVRDAVANDLGIDAGASSYRSVMLLEYHDGCAFAHHETVPVAVERSRCARGIVVSR